MKTTRKIAKRKMLSNITPFSPTFHEFRISNNLLNCRQNSSVASLPLNCDCQTSSSQRIVTIHDLNLPEEFSVLQVHFGAHLQRITQNLSSKSRFHLMPFEVSVMSCKSISKAKFNFVFKFKEGCDML